MFYNVHGSLLTDDGYITTNDGNRAITILAPTQIALEIIELSN